MAETFTDMPYDLTMNISNKTWSLY